MLKNKIESVSGATILIALLFFLLCAMVGSVVLAAGTAASGRIAGLEENQQSYYSVTSAARILRDEIEEQRFEYYKDTIAKTDTTAETVTRVYLVEPDGALKEVLKKSAEAIFEGDNTYTDTISIYPANAKYKDSLKTVRGVFTMNKDYSIVIDLQISDKGSENKYQCRITIPALVARFNEETSGIVSDGGAQNGKEYKRVDTALLWRGALIEKN